jgi:trimethylamine--corrinoid protein Co-methyltransferase
MSVKGYIRNMKPLEVLSGEQLEEIHSATLQVLRRTGVQFDSTRALRLFEKNECQVDHDTNRVRFPEGLVEECLRKAPSRFHVRSRNSDNDMVWGGNATYFQALSGTKTVDLDT